MPNFPANLPVPECLMELHKLCEGKSLYELDYMRRYLVTETTYKNEAERNLAIRASMPEGEATIEVKPELSAKGAVLSAKYTGSIWMHNPTTGERKRIQATEKATFVANGFLDGPGKYSVEKAEKPAKMVKMGGRGKGGIGTKWMYKGKEVVRVKSSDVPAYEARGFLFGKKAPK